MRAWSTITSNQTREGRETLAAVIAAVADEQTRETLRAAMNAVFLSLEADLERATKVQR